MYLADHGWNDLRQQSHFSLNSDDRATGKSPRGSARLSLDRELKAQNASVTASNFLKCEVLLPCGPGLLGRRSLKSDHSFFALPTRGAVVNRE
jgi:hypothetical protein